MDRIAFVTGADRGLGLALTAGLLERGWRVFAGQYMPDWPSLAALSAQWGEALTLTPLDVSDTASVQAAAASVAAQVEHVDLLISNAGIGLASFGCRQVREITVRRLSRILRVCPCQPRRHCRISSA